MKLRWLLIGMCITVSMIPIGIIGGVRGFEFATMFLMILILFVTFCVSLAISYFISHPLEKLTTNIDKISKGDLSINLEESEIYEINNLTYSLNRVMASLKLAIHKVGVKRGEIFEETLKAKEEVEEKYNLLLNVINEWVWEIDVQGIITQSSAKSMNVLGYQPQQLIGKPLTSFLPQDDGKTIESILNQPQQNTQSILSIENSYIHRDGHIVQARTSLLPLYDEHNKLLGYRGIEKHLTVQNHPVPAKNKTASRTKQPRKPEITKQHDTIQPGGNATDFLLYCNDETDIVDCTTAMHTLLGYTREEFLALNVADFDMFETKESFKQKLCESKIKGSFLIKTIHKRKDGSSLLVSEQIEYLKDKNLFQCLIKEEQFDKNM